MGQGDDWIDDVMSVVDDVDWQALNHAYGSAELTPLALRTWLSGDDRRTAEVPDDDPVARIIAEYPSERVAESALAWIAVSVFHQGSLYSASPPTCRVMVEALDHAEDETTWFEAMSTLSYALSLDDVRSDWRAHDFDRRDFRHPETYDEVVTGFDHYVAAIDSEFEPEVRATAARILAWMPDRESSAEAIIDALSEEPFARPGSAAAMAEDAVTAALLRTLGVVAGGTTVEEQAELGARSLVEAPDPIGMAACLALARLRKVGAEDASVVQRLRDALADRRTDAALHALMTTALSSDGAAAAEALARSYVDGIRPRSEPNTSDFQAMMQYRVDLIGAQNRATCVAGHLGLTLEWGEES